MLNQITNTLSILLTFGVLSGVALHDSQFDKFVAAFTVEPAISIHDDSRSEMRPGNPHIHGERVSLGQAFRSLGGGEPLMRPRGNNDKKYLLQNRLMARSYDNDYIWPSI